jgi:hypothetical protein
MAKLSKVQRDVILIARFPEFFRLSQDFDLALDAMLESLHEKVSKIEEIQEQLEEVRTAKAELDNEI